MKNLKLLLKEIMLINQKNSILKRESADGFNIFSVLLKTSDEVNLHSKFIHELLNPKGSHQQGSLFLNLFLKEMEVTPLKGKVSLYREKDNIDILIQSSAHSIIIENKIYTQDHSFQLSRYVSIIEREGYAKEDISLVYLTLFGEEPREQELEIDVTLLSYQKNICSWIEASLEHTKTIPILHETLKQYLDIINGLTHQSKERRGIVEIKDFLLKESHLQTIIALEPSIIEAKVEIQLNFWKRLLDNLMKADYHFTFYNMNSDNIGLTESVQRYYQFQKNSKDYGIKYQVDENLIFFVELRNNIFYGFEFEDEAMIEEAQKEMIDSLEVVWRESFEDIYWKYPRKPLDFKSFNHQNVFDLINEEQAKEDIEKISNEIIRLISGFNKNKRIENV